MLDTPNFLINLNLSKEPIKFSWNDDNATELYSKDVPVVERALVPVSILGVMAFSTACAEWVAARFVGTPRREILCQIIEAAWAAQFDLNLFQPLTGLKERFEKDFSGPAKGAIFHTSSVLRYSIKLIQQDDPRLSDAASVNILAEHVLSDKKPFRDWRARAIKYLSENSPSGKKDKVGKPIPREYFWSFRSLDKDSAKSIKDFVSAAQTAKNPFVG